MWREREPSTVAPERCVCSQWIVDIPALPRREMHLIELVHERPGIQDELLRPCVHGEPQRLDRRLPHRGRRPLCERRKAEMLTTTRSRTAASPSLETRATTRPTSS